MPGNRRNIKRGGAADGDDDYGSSLRSAGSRRSNIDDDDDLDLEPDLPDTDDYWEDDSGPGPRLMTAETLQGDDVVNNEGETLGEIQDIMIDVPTGRVAYAVLSVGGFLGMGDKLFAIPWSALELDPENHRFILDVDKDEFENAPGFDKGNWPSMADEQWANEVHAYYDARPYWD